MFLIQWISILFLLGNQAFAAGQFHCSDGYEKLPPREGFAYLTTRAARRTSTRLAKEALLALEQGRAEEAFQLATKAVSMNPHQYEAQAFLGERALKVGQLEAAAQHFEMAHLNPSRGKEVSVKLLEIYEVLKQYQMQLQAVYRALELDPGNFNFKVLRVNLLIDLGELVLARELFPDLKSVSEVREPGFTLALEVKLLKAEGKYGRALKRVNDRIQILERGGEKFKWELEKLNLLESLDAQPYLLVRQIDVLLKYNDGRYAEVLLGKKIILLMESRSTTSYRVAAKTIPLLKAIASESPGSKLFRDVEKMEAQVLFHNGKMEGAWKILMRHALLPRGGQPDLLAIAGLMRIDKMGAEDALMPGKTFYYSDPVRDLFQTLTPEQYQTVVYMEANLNWSFRQRFTQPGATDTYNSFWDVTVHFSRPVDGVAVRVSTGSHTY